MYELNGENIKDIIWWNNQPSPVYCYLEITGKCNSKCMYCQMELTYNDLEEKKFEYIIDQLKLNNILEVRFGGGEPLCCEDLIKKIEYCKNKNLSVILCTNGYNYTDSLIKKFKELNLDGVRVSLDFLNDKEHDEIRGLKGSAKRAKKFMRLCKKCGISVTVSMTVGKHNISEIPKIQHYCELNSYHFATHSIMPIGKGKNFYDEELNGPSTSSSNIDVITSNVGEKHCVAASELISIDIKGNVSACTFLKPFNNIFNKSLCDIINCNNMKRYLYPTNSNKCNNCPYSLTKKEGKCKLSGICRGGCWAIEEIKNENITN